VYANPSAVREAGLTTICRNPVIGSMVQELMRHIDLSEVAAIEATKPLTEVMGTKIRRYAMRCVCV
jgi:hypothetical protein